MYILWVAVNPSLWILANDALVNVKHLALQERKKERDWKRTKRRETEGSVSQLFASSHGINVPSISGLFQTVFQ